MIRQNLTLLPTKSPSCGLEWGPGFKGSGWDLAQVCLPREILRLSTLNHCKAEP